MSLIDDPRLRPQRTQVTDAPPMPRAVAAAIAVARMKEASVAATPVAQVADDAEAPIAALADSATLPPLPRPAFMRAAVAVAYATGSGATRRPLLPAQIYGREKLTSWELDAEMQAAVNVGFAQHIIPDATFS